jgi:hypothetical protein
MGGIGGNSEEVGVLENRKLAETCICSIFRDMSKYQMCTGCKFPLINMSCQWYKNEYKISLLFFFCPSYHSSYTVL